MSSTTRKLLLLIALYFGGISAISGTVSESLSPLRRQNEFSRKLHPKFKSLTEKLLYSSKEKVENLDNYTPLSVTKNSNQPLDGFKSNEGVAKAVAHVTSYRGKFRRHTRRKRNTKDSFLPWKFNVNVSRLASQNTESSSKEDVTIPKVRIEKPGTHLEVALHVKGNDLDDSYSEMNHAWDSTENFLKQLFGGNIEELSERGHGVFVDLNGLPSKVHAGEFLTKNSVNDKTQSQQKDKEGKFLFGLFGPGGNSENPPINQGNEEAVDNKMTTESPLMTSSPIDGMDHATISEILNDFTHSQQLEEPITPEESEAQGIVSKEKFATDVSETLSTHLTESSNQNGLLTHGNEQSTRKLDVLETSTAATQSKSTTESAFTEEDFLKFCISLLPKMQKLPRLLDEFSDMEGSGSVGLKESGAISVEATSHGQIPTESISQQKPQSMGFFASLLNRITGGRSRQEPSTSGTEPSTSGTEPSSHIDENRKARIFNLNNLFAAFGSGRSADLNELENMKFDDIDLNTTQNIETGIFNASDCEMFLQLIRGENFQSESPNVLNHSTQMELKPNFKDDLSFKESTSFTTENLQDTKGERFFEGLFGSGDAINLKPENAEDDDVSTLENIGRETTTGISVDQKDRIFNVLGFSNGFNVGSGSSNLPEEKKLVFRSFFNVGSGGREIGEDSLSDHNTENTLTVTTASPDLRIFPGFFNFGSGERNFKESFEFQTDNMLDVVTDKEGRTFGEFGSGERQMQEKVESLSTNFTSDILNFEDVSVRELPIQYNETDLYFTNYEKDHELATTVDGLQTRMAKEERRVYSDVLERSDTLLSVTETDKQDRSIIRFPNAGSGDGRDLEGNENFESRNKRKPGCSVVCTIENDTNILIKCSECAVESTTDIPMEAFTETPHDFTESEISLGLVSSHVEYADTRSVNSPESRQTDKLRQRGLKDTTVNQLSPHPIDDTITATSNKRTEGNESRLAGRIFFSINEDNGPINLVQETELTPATSDSLSPRNTRKRGRMVDDPLDSKDMEPENFEDINTNRKRSKDSDDLPETLREVTSVSEELRTLDSSTELIKLFSDDIVQVSNQTERSDGEFMGSLSTLPSKQGSSEHATTNTPVLMTEPVNTFIQRRYGSESRFCITDDECDSSLNEQCTSKTFMGVCGCGVNFVRHSKTGKCEDPFRLKAQLLFPGEAFRKVLKDESSDYFHKMRKNSENTMRLLIVQDPNLRDSLVRVEVQDFEEGSLIVNYDITFVKEQNTNSVEFMQKVDVAVTEALKNKDVMEKTPLNILNAQVVSVGTFTHRCDAKELNYCSVNADCIPFGDQFKCKCKDGYMDNSREGFVGEICVEYCPPAYCGENGYCDMRFEGQKNCLCKGWYFGQRCQIPGLLIIGGFAILNIAVVLTILGIVCICRRRRHRSARYYGSDTPTVNANESFGRLSAVPSRLQDTVAMNEMGLGGATKYVLRSTPVQGLPAVNVISPSNEESSMSIDFDSTFDTSENIEEENKIEKL